MIWVGAAAAVMVLVLGLSYGTSLSESTPGLFWTLYGVLAIVVLGLLGHAYEPADDYYLGWYGMSDDPFTLRDDVDRSHMTLGFVVAVPRVIVGSFGTIFGSSWLIRGLDSAEIYGAASVLHALGEQRVEEAEQKLKFAGEKSAARILRALDKMGYVRPDGGHLRLTSKGERLVGVSDVL